MLWDDDGCIDNCVGVLEIGPFVVADCLIDLFHKSTVGDARKLPAMLSHCTYLRPDGCLLNGQLLVLILLVFFSLTTVTIPLSMGYFIGSGVVTVVSYPKGSGVMRVVRHPIDNSVVRVSCSNGV